jgi:hypothetical protein
MNRILLFLLMIAICSIAICEEVLLYEGFEGEEFPPEGWFLYSFAGEESSWLHGLTSEIEVLIPFSGEAVAMSKSSCGDDGCLFPENYLFTPQISIPIEAENATLRYYVAILDPDFPVETLSILISEDGMILANFELLTSETFDSENSVWSIREISLDMYIGADIIIGFLHHDSTGESAVMIDNIEIVINSGTNERDILRPNPENRLLRNYPNPFNPTTSIQFIVNESIDHVYIDIYNIRGQLIRSLIDAEYPFGDHTIVWNGTDNNGQSVGSGIYFYQMKTKKYTDTRKMILMK